MLNSHFSKSVTPLLFALSTLMASTPSYAAVKVMKKVVTKPFVAAKIPENDNFTILPEGEYEKVIEYAKKSSASGRTPSQTQVDRIDYATVIPDDYKNLMADLQGGRYWANGKEVAKGPVPTAKPAPTFLNPFPGYTPSDPNEPSGVKNGNDLAALITKVEAKLTSKDPKSQFSTPAKIVAAQLVALKPYRGILYRLRPVAERQHTPFIHGMVISYLRSLNAGVNNLYPSEQWHAGFDYISRPYAGMGPQISDENDLNLFIAAQVLPNQIALLNRINAVDATTPFYLDNQIFWKEAKFTSDHDRFQLVGNAEKYAYLSVLSANISSIYNSLAYDWSDLFKATQGYWTVYGFNTSFARPDNMTAKQRTKEIKSNEKLFTLLPGGATLTNKAYGWFKTSLRCARASWTLVQKEEVKSDAKNIPFMDPRAFVPFSRTINASFANIEDLIGGKGIASAVVNGEIVDVNFAEFFTNPPADLKDFLPTDTKENGRTISGFASGDRELKDDATGLMYRNYNRENPQHWDAKKYATYFPGVKNDDDVKRTVRVLSQSWGGGVLGFPLAAVLY